MRDRDEGEEVSRIYFMLGATLSWRAGFRPRDRTGLVRCLVFACVTVWMRLLALSTAQHWTCDLLRNRSLHFFKYWRVCRTLQLLAAWHSICAIHGMDAKIQENGEIRRVRKRKSHERCPVHVCWHRYSLSTDKGTRPRTRAHVLFALACESSSIASCNQFFAEIVHELSMYVRKNTTRRLYSTGTPRLTLNPTHRLRPSCLLSEHAKDYTSPTNTPAFARSLNTPSCSTNTRTFIRETQRATGPSSSLGPLQAPARAPKKHICRMRRPRR